MHAIQVVGPRELETAERLGKTIIWTVSNSPDNWQSGLSPFLLGPVSLYDGSTARCMENAWQYAKVYSKHTDENKLPTEEYWKWARKGWASAAVRYPMGKGAKPEYLLWKGRQLRYIEARKQVYWELYRNAVATSPAFSKLKEMHAAGPITLMDFDGYDHEYRQMSLGDVIEFTGRPMGHAFVLKAMLLFGADVTAEQAAQADQLRPGGAKEQGSLF